MKGIKAWFVIGVATVGVAAGGWALAQDEEQLPDMAAMMEAMAQLARPVEAHEQLKQFEGVWDAQVRILGGPEPIEARGVSQNEVIFGGRFLMSEYKGEFMGKPMLGMGFDGYDKQANKHIGIWFDTLGTTIMHFEGEASEDGKVRTMYGDVVDPMTGETKNVKGVTKVVSTNRFTYEAWEKHGDGDYVQTMQVIFSKR